MSVADIASLLYSIEFSTHIEVPTELIESIRTPEQVSLPSVSISVEAVFDTSIR